MGGNNVPTHFLNTNNFVGGIKIRTKKQQALYLGISSYQTNKGDGIKGDNGAPLFAGAEPGDFESLNRIHYTVGYKMSIHDNILLGYLSYISAVKLTAEDSPAPGYYDLKVILFGFGLVMN